MQLNKKKKETTTIDDKFFILSGSARFISRENGVK